MSTLTVTAVVETRVTLVQKTHHCGAVFAVRENKVKIFCPECGEILSGSYQRSNPDPGTYGAKMKSIRRFHKRTQMEIASEIAPTCATLINDKYISLFEANKKGGMHQSTFDHIKKWVDDHYRPEMDGLDLR